MCILEQVGPSVWDPGCIWTRRRAYCVGVREMAPRGLRHTPSLGPSASCAQGPMHMRGGRGGPLPWGVLWFGGAQELEGGRGECEGTRGAEASGEGGPRSDLGVLPGGLWPCVFCSAEVCLVRGVQAWPLQSCPWRVSTVGLDPRAWRLESETPRVGAQEGWLLPGTVGGVGGECPPPAAGGGRGSRGARGLQDRTGCVGGCWRLPFHTSFRLRYESGRGGSVVRAACAPAARRLSGHRGSARCSHGAGG